MSTSCYLQMHGGRPSWQDGRVQLRRMIVDDDEWFLEVARTLLEQGGVTVAGIAGSCTAAVERVGALRPESSWSISAWAGSPDSSGQGPGGQRARGRLIMISSHAEADYADLIAEAPSPGSCPRPSCPPWPSAACSEWPESTARVPPSFITASR